MTGAAAREYPARPIVGVGGVVRNAAGRIALVRRKHAPLKGRWSLPGGAVEIGETLAAAVAREVYEETGLTVEVGPAIGVFDRIHPDARGKVRYHYVLIDYLCRVRGGMATAGSDVDDVRWVAPSRLAPYRLAREARQAVAKAIELDRSYAW